MVRHLDPTYEESEKPSGAVPHFFDTIDALGGWKGGLLTVFLVYFLLRLLVFSLVNFFILVYLFTHSPAHSLIHLLF